MNSDTIPNGAITIERRHILSFDPQVAALIGLSEAIVLGEIIWYTTDPRSRSGKFVDGERWIYNSYDEWAEVFPFWGPANIKKIIARLEERGLIKSRQDLNELPFDRTKWYTVNLENPAYDVRGTCHTVAPASDTTVSVPSETVVPDNTNLYTTPNLPSSDSKESSTAPAPPDEAPTDAGKAKFAKGTAPDEIIIKAFCEETGLAKITNWPLARKQAKKLVAADFTPDEVRQLVRWLKSQPWVNGGVDLNLMVNQADKFRTAVSQVPSDTSRFIHRQPSQGVSTPIPPSDRNPWDDMYANMISKRQQQMGAHHD